MALKALQVFNFRNLAQQTVEFGPSLNIIYGKNGSGKTSLLEAIYLLSHGKSFRTRRTKTILASHAYDNSIVVRGSYSISSERDAPDQSCLISAAIKKTPTEAYLAKVDGETVHSISVLAKISPTLILEPRSFDLLIGGPSFRRKFLDWGVFHVEHEFAEIWKRYINCLKQRNSLLRSGKLDGQLFKTWEKSLADTGEQISSFRKVYFEAFRQEFEALKSQFLDESLGKHIRLRLDAGWDEKNGLLEQLDAGRAKDIKRLQTTIGPHRADVRILFKGLAATDVLSRGQQKLLIITLYLANVLTLKKASGKPSVLLFDDVAAELDSTNLDNTMLTLLETNAQIICTALQLETFSKLTSAYNDKKVFHVEHGLVSCIE